MKTKIGEILGDRNKMDMIIGLFHVGPQKKTDVYAFTTNNNLNARKLDELERDGLISMLRDSFNYNMTTVALTVDGSKVVKKLLEIECVLSGENCPEGGQIDYDAPLEQRDSIS